MSNEIRILGCPVLPLDKGLEEDGIKYGVRRPMRDHAGWMERYSREPFSFVGLHGMILDVRSELAAPGLPLNVLISTSTIEQIRKDMESGAYRL